MLWNKSRLKQILLGYWRSQDLVQADKGNVQWTWKNVKNTLMV